MDNLTYPCTRNGQKADTHHHSADCYLSISKFNTIQIQDRQTVSADKTVECKNLVHLNCGDQSTTTLANNVWNSHHISQFTGKWSSDRGVSELNGWWFFIFQHL